mmetsp:Transcript_1476/g.3333  ORF Transcript_1476/g.3333 Transcript_1476/m.3333 type:complete len:217 (+) Transcript_1476:1912-2562(+)
MRLLLSSLLTLLLCLLLLMLLKRRRGWRLGWGIIITIGGSLGPRGILLLILLYLLGTGTVLILLWYCLLLLLLLLLLLCNPGLFVGSLVFSECLQWSQSPRRSICTVPFHGTRGRRSIGVGGNHRPLFRPLQNNIPVVVPAGRLHDRRQRTREGGVAIHDGGVRGDARRILRLPPAALHAALTAPLAAAAPTAPLAGPIVRLPLAAPDHRIEIPVQ